MPGGEAVEGTALRIFTLGGFRVQRGAISIPESAWRRPSGKLLLKLLAVAAPHRLHREQILEALWPDLEPKSANASLRKALHFARHALEADLPDKSASSFILSSSETIEFAHSVWVDIDEFTALAASSLRGSDVAALERAHAAYGGDLLPEDRYRDWVTARSSTLQGLHLHLLLRLADELERQGAARSAIDYLREILATDPSQETVLRRLMQLYARIGNRHAALRQYHASREVLRREFDVEPEQETEALRGEILAAPTGSMGGTAPHTDLARGLALPVPLRHVPASPFIGRERARSLLVDGLDRARGGAGDMVLIGGEAGIGKTRLLAEVAREANEVGAMVLWGASFPHEGSFPYGPIAEALDGYISLLPFTERERLGASYVELHALLPSLQAGVEPSFSSLDPERDSRGLRAALFNAVVRLLDEIVGTQSLFLVLDDLQAADVNSLQLLHYLARAGTHRTWIIAGTYREEDVTAGGDFQTLVAEMTRQGLCRRIQLLRLGRRESDRLARSLLPDGPVAPRMLDHLYALSLGNPLFMRELVADVRERGAFTNGDTGWDCTDFERTHVPSSIQDLVASRVERLPGTVRTVLDLAATAGMECSFADLRACCTSPETSESESEQQLLDALDAALNARILEEQETGYVFAHPLIRVTLYDRLSRPRRGHLHGLLARHIEERRPDDMETLAYHYARTEDTEKALVYLERAGDRAWAVFAADAAVASFSAAIDRARDPGDAAIVARLHRKRAVVRQGEGRYAEALDDLSEARRTESDLAIRIELWRHQAVVLGKRGEFEAAVAAYRCADVELPRRGDVPTEPSLLTRAQCDLDVTRAFTYLQLGALDEADQAIARATSLLPRVLDDLRIARLGLVQGQVAQRRGEYAEARQRYDAALQLAKDADDLEGQQACWSNLGMLASEEADFERADDCLERSLELAQRTKDPYATALILNNLGVSAHERGRYDRATEYYRRSMALREELGDREGLAVCVANLGEIACFQGHYDTAEVYLQRSLDLQRDIGDRPTIAYVWFMLGDVSRCRGALGGAEERYRRSLEMREEMGDRPGCVQSNVGLAQVACMRGDLLTSYALARQMRRLARGRAPSLETAAVLTQAHSRLRTGRTRTAEMLANYANHLAAQHALGRSEVEATLLLADVLWARRRVGEARCAAQTGLNGARERGMALEEGIANRALGQCMSGVDAVSRLRESLHILERIGAMLEAARTRVALVEVLRAEDKPAHQERTSAEVRALLKSARDAFISAGATLDLAGLERLTSTEPVPD